MPPKKQKKGEPQQINPGHVVALPRAAPDVVEVAHPTSLPSFLVGSSLFILASHSRGTLEAAQKDDPAAKQQAQLQLQLEASMMRTPRGGAAAAPGGKKAAPSSPTSPLAGSPSAKKAFTGGKAAAGGAGAEQPLDVAAAVTTRSAPSWNLVVQRKSIFECGDLLGDLACAVNSNSSSNNKTGADDDGTSAAAANAGRCDSVLSVSSTTSSALMQHASNAQLPQQQQQQQQPARKPIDFAAVRSFSAHSSPRHALVLVTEESGAQRVFVGGSNVEGQLPLPILLERSNGKGGDRVVLSRSSTPSGDNGNDAVHSNAAVAQQQKQQQQRAMPVADTAAVPFRELVDLEFKIVHATGGAGSGANAAAVQQPALVANARALLTQGEEARRRVAAAEAALRKTATTVLKHSDGAHIVGAACGSAHTVVLVKNPTASPNSWAGAPSTYLFGCGRAAAIGNPPPPPSSSSALAAGSQQPNEFRHLPVGDGEDFDAVWAFGDCTYARGRRGLVAFGTVCSDDGRKKYHTPTQAQVVIPAPLGCLAQEVIVLNAIGDRPSSTLVYVQQQQQQPVVPSSAASQDEGDREEQRRQQQMSYLFGGTRLLEVHAAFPGGEDGGLKTMLHPPPPVFSFADVTDRVLGSVASSLRKMGASAPDGLRLKKLCCGSEHAIAVTAEGAVIGFGSNHFGQLGATAGGAERGPQYADEMGIGPRTARLYPVPDCTMVPPTLRKQYYESAVLLRPPALRRSALALAAAQAQLKGRTVEFNEVVSVVPIPPIDHNTVSSTGSGLVGAAADEDEDTFDDEDDAVGPASPQQQKGGGGGMGPRRSTAFPSKMMAASVSANRGKKAPASPPRMSNSGRGKPSGPSSSVNVAGDDAASADGGANSSITAVMNPAWPHSTVVDCCCGPLFTVLMQADAQLVVLGDDLPPVVRGVAEQLSVPNHAAVN